jgi:phosphatidylserine/phosphatidylglycerophosphate/cardiolipin synthase-like enzyme
MTLVKVAVPVLQGRRKFHFDKGRPWTLFEHILLHEIERGPTTVSTLASRADVPPRIVIEALIRLMRAAWVEMTQHASGVQFQITPEGRVAKEYDQLPTAPRRMSRNMTFVVDQITGTVFRSRELPFLHKHIVEERSLRETVVWMERPEAKLAEGTRPLVDALFQDDEKFVAMDPYGDRLADRWALVSVRDGQPEGLSPRAPGHLIGEILKAAKSAKAGPGATQSTSYEATQQDDPLASIGWPARSVTFSSADLVVGGEEHETALRLALSKAKHRIIIHSTFIAEDRFNALLPQLTSALSAGARIDVLWGQDKEAVGRRSTMGVVQRLRASLDQGKLDRLTVHPFSTGSHAKVLVTDEGHPEKLVAVVGSCNWLYSGFKSFEVSARLRDPHIVADVIDQIAELSRGGSGHWTSLTTELTALATSLRGAPTKASKTTASIVIGSRHAELIREARDEAQKRIVVASHKFAGAAKNLILAPMFAAAAASNVDTRIFYGEGSGAISGVKVAELTIDAGKLGTTVRPILRPTLHAKFLAWDDDTVVVTSQNWLSADTVDDNPRQEIGICIRSPGIARILIERFEAATATAS